jgi:hypothetical protein
MPSGRHHINDAHQPVVTTLGMLRVFCSALSPLLPDLGVELLLEPSPLFEDPPEEAPEEDDFEEEDEEPLPPPLVLDPEPPPFLVPALEEEELSVGVVTAGAAPVLVPGAAAPGVATEITCAGTVAAFPPLARTINTPTPIANSSTPTPATAVAPEERPPTAAPPPPLDGAGPETVAGVKRLRNWLRACTWRPPHSRQ